MRDANPVSKPAYDGLLTVTLGMVMSKRSVDPAIDGPGRTQEASSVDGRYKFTGNPDKNIPQTREISGCAKSELYEIIPDGLS